MFKARLATRDWLFCLIYHHKKTCVLALRKLIVKYMVTFIYFNIFRIIFYFHSIGILRMLIWSDYKIWYTKIIAVRRDFQNNAICYLTPATYLFLVPTIRARRFNAKNDHFCTARIYGYRIYRCYRPPQHR